MWSWVNGKTTALEQGTISVIDHGFTVGDGVFETLKTVDGVPFALTRHLRRLRRSAAGLGLPDPDEGRVRDAVAEVMSAQAFPLGVLRITYTSGPGPLGSNRGDQGTTLACVSMPGKPWPATTQVSVSRWPRNERSPLVGLKTTSYAENAVCLAESRADAASEAILGNLAGNLCEGTGSNVFVVMDGQVFTPYLSDGCLAGITRELVLEWSDVAERTLPLDVLERADEVFITSSTRDVHPVDRVGERVLTAPGAVTARIAEQFAIRSAQDPDPA
ncbi:MAG: aminotransferase class IV [Candidatus Nanopelagicales bacterium]|jgi:branched-chain amino acid aminotransferase|nr:aminotransferase class IV [Candidatus Nanopelagicales bacterium]